MVTVDVQVVRARLVQRSVGATPGEDSPVRRQTTRRDKVTDVVTVREPSTSYLRVPGVLSGVHYKCWWVPNSC